MTKSAVSDGGSFDRIHRMNRMSGWKRKAEIPGIAFFRFETDLPHPVDPVHPVEKRLDPVPGLCQRPWRGRR